MPVTNAPAKTRPASGGRVRRTIAAPIQRGPRVVLRRRRRLLVGGAIAAVVIGAGIAYAVFRSPADGAGSVQEFPIQGRTHIQRGQAHPAYNSTPPTSGWHYADQVASPGVHAEPVPNEVQVHNLEHGEIMVQYDCPTGCPEMVAELERIVRSFPRKVVLAPYPGLGRRIALSSWGRLAYLEGADEGAIRGFIRAYKDKGPEYFPDEPMAVP